MNKKAVMAPVCGILLLALTVLLTGCHGVHGSDGNVVNEEQPGEAVMSGAGPSEMDDNGFDEGGLLNEISDLGYQVMLEKAKEDGHKNTVVSVLPIYEICRTILPYADGSARQELEALFPSIGNCTHVPGRDRDSTLWKGTVWANSGQGISLSDDFIKSIKDTGLDAQNTTFSDKVLRRIGAGIIEREGDEKRPTSDDEVYITDLSEFRSNWDEQFSGAMVTEGAEFNNADGTKSSATMLCDVENDFISVLGGAGFVKYFENARTAFAAVMPPEGIEINEYISMLRGSDLRDALNKRTSDYEVRVTFPSFSIERSTGLKKAASASGIPSLFAESSDLARTSRTEGLSWKISEYVQSVRLSIDKNGCGGTASSSLGSFLQEEADTEKEIITVTFDRPFLFVIFDVKDTIPLYVGVINHLQ